MLLLLSLARAQGPSEAVPHAGAPVGMHGLALPQPGRGPPRSSRCLLALPAHVWQGQKMICALKTPYLRHLSVHWGNESVLSLLGFLVFAFTFVSESPGTDFSVWCKVSAFQILFYNCLKWRGKKRPSLETPVSRPLVH